MPSESDSPTSLESHTQAPLPKESYNGAQAACRPLIAARSLNSQVHTLEVSAST